MTNMNLTIYIDPALLKPDPKTGQVQVGNLAFARKVGGVANVIFQSKTSAFFSESNLFSWDQAYQIGGTMTPPQPSSFVKASTGPKSIDNGQMCDWSPKVPNGPPLQYMPKAILADQGFLDRFPKGTFGTKNEPAMWYNSIWCSTGGGGFSPIFAETTPPVPGMNYRAYQVENNYQVSWETESFAGILTGSWTHPFPFSIQPGGTAAYLSWGYPPPDPKVPVPTPMWYDYGTTDPGRHNPSQADRHSDANSLNTLALHSLTESSLQTMAPSSLALLDIDPVFLPKPLRMCLSWNGPDKAYNAEIMFEYLYRSTRGWLQMCNVCTNGDLLADVTFQSNTSFGDYLPGETENDKIRFYLGSLINNIAPRYAPNTLNWNSRVNQSDPKDENGHTPADGSFSDIFKLGWKNLPPGAVLAAAAASAAYLSKLMTKAWNSKYSPAITLEFEWPVETASGQAISKFKASNLNANQFEQALTMFKSIVRQEHDRAVKVPGNPDLATPDDVTLYDIWINDDEINAPSVHSSRMINGSNEKGEPDDGSAQPQPKSFNSTGFQPQHNYAYGQPPPIAAQ